MSIRHGLRIGDEPVGRSNENFQSILKFALVAVDKQGSPEFHSQNMADVLPLIDPLDIEIALAMIDDYILHEFADPNALAENIALRKGVIAAMRGLGAGRIDGDYVEAAVGVPPTLGYLRNLEVLLAPGAKTGKGILTKEAPFTSPISSWMHMPDTTSWSGFMFMQKPDVALSDALKDITPFRGECAGALQLSILIGCLTGLGAEKTDALRAHYGPAFIGAGSVLGAKGKPRVTTVASQFLSQQHDVPEDYKRGGLIAVPGDFLYFKNKDDYPTLSPTGGWRGENCIYMGQDALGDPHYSGLGLSWKTEFALRMFLGNAYFTDANTAYLEERRAGKASDLVPAIVEEPLKQVRFTARAIMRYPKINASPPPIMRLPTSNPAPMSDSDIRNQLNQLDFIANINGTFDRGEMLLQDLMDAMKIADTEMQQVPSAASNDAGLMVLLGQWTLHIEALNRKVQHLASDDKVRVHAVYGG